MSKKTRIDPNLIAVEGSWIKFGVRETEQYVREELAKHLALVGKNNDVLANFRSFPIKDKPETLNAVRKLHVLLESNNCQLFKIIGFLETIPAIALSEHSMFSNSKEFAEKIQKLINKKLPRTGLVYLLGITDGLLSHQKRETRQVRNTLISTELRYTQSRAAGEAYRKTLNGYRESMFKNKPDKQRRGQFDYELQKLNKVVSHKRLHLITALQIKSRDVSAHEASVYFGIIFFLLKDILHKETDAELLSRADHCLNEGWKISMDSLKLFELAPITEEIKQLLSDQLNDRLSDKTINAIFESIISSVNESLAKSLRFVFSQWSKITFIGDSLGMLTPKKIHGLRLALDDVYNEEKTIENDHPELLNTNSPLDFFNNMLKVVVVIRQMYSKALFFTKESNHSKELVTAHKKYFSDLHKFIKGIGLSIDSLHSNKMELSQVECYTEEFGELVSEPLQAFLDAIDKEENGVSKTSEENLEVESEHMSKPKV